MKALLGAALMAFPSAAQADGAEKLVAKFVELCMGEKPAFETLESIAKANGWSPEEGYRAGPHTFQEIPIQSMVIKRWKAPSEGLPGMSVSVGRSTMGPSNASATTDSCGVDQPGFQSESTQAQLKAALNLPDPRHSLPLKSEGSITVWERDTPRLSIILTESATSTSIMRTRTLSKEKP